MLYVLKNIIYSEKYDAAIKGEIIIKSVGVAGSGALGGKVIASCFRASKICIEILSIERPVIR